MFDIEKALQSISDRYTVEMREEDESRQRDARTSFNPLSLDARICRAVVQEKNIAAQIVMLTQEPDSEIKRQRLYQALDRLSELLAEQGKYDEAMEVTPNAERKEYFQNIRFAINARDAMTCECADDVVNNKSRSPIVPIDEISTANGIKTLYRCRKCGFMNAR